MRSLNTITFYFSLVALGLSVVAFSMPAVTTLTSEVKKEKGYLFALQRELADNSREADRVVREYKEKGAINVLPTYRTNAYDAIIEAGLLNKFALSTPGELVNLYSHIAQWPVLLDAVNSEINPTERGRMIALHSSNVSNYYSDISKGFDFDASTERELFIYRFVSVAGITIIIIALVGSAIDTYHPFSKIDGLLKFIQRTIRPKKS